MACSQAPVRKLRVATRSKHSGQVLPERLAARCQWAIWVAGSVAARAALISPWVARSGWKGAAGCAWAAGAGRARRRRTTMWAVWRLLVIWRLLAIWGLLAIWRLMTVARRG